jgi:hypothetical protein
MELRRLTLFQNPIERAPNYKLVVPALLPQLTHLDGRGIDKVTVAKVSNSMILEAACALSLLEEELEDEQRFELAVFNAESDFGCDPSKDIFDPSLGLSALPDTGSELTYGSDLVLAGSASNAIRRRKNKTSGVVEESPLSILDHAHHARVPFEAEGDVTQQFAGMWDLAKARQVPSASREIAAVDVTSQERPSSARSSAPSPRQINASRPQSAVAYGSQAIFRKQALNSPPLKVVHIDEEQPKKSQRRSQRSKRGGQLRRQSPESSEEDDDDGDDEVMPRRWSDAEAPSSKPDNSDQSTLKANRARKV